MVRFFLISFCFLSIVCCAADGGPVVGVGSVKEVKIAGSQVRFVTDNAFGEVTVYSPTVVRVRLDRHPLGRDVSYAVVAAPSSAAVRVSDAADVVTLVTDSLKVVIGKKPFRVSFYTLSGAVINADEAGLNTS